MAAEFLICAWPAHIKLFSVFYMITITVTHTIALAHRFPRQENCQIFYTFHCIFYSKCTLSPCCVACQPWLVCRWSHPAESSGSRASHVVFVGKTDWLEFSEQSYEDAWWEWFSLGEPCHGNWSPFKQTDTFHWENLVSLYFGCWYSNYFKSLKVRLSVEFRYFIGIHWLFLTVCFYSFFKVFICMFFYVALPCRHPIFYFSVYLLMFITGYPLLFADLRYYFGL